MSPKPPSVSRLSKPRDQKHIHSQLRGQKTQFSRNSIPQKQTVVGYTHHRKSLIRLFFRLFIPHDASCLAEFLGMRAQEPLDQTLMLR